MTLPGFFLGVIVSSLYGSAFHLYRGGSLPRLFLYLVISWVGFWVGHFGGGALGLTFWTVGTLNLGSATLGSLIFLVVGHWLSLIQVERQ